MTPAVTIAMPIYNGSKTVRDALGSLLAQTFTDFELIASDNASSDETLAILEDIAQADPRVRVIRRTSTSGAAQHFNDVFALRRGTYFMWAACDDLWHPQFVERTYRLLESRPEAVAALTQIAFINDQNLVLGMDGNMAATSSNIVERMRIIFNRVGWYALYGLMRADIMARTELFRKSFGGDVLFVAELLLHGAFAIVDAPLFAYRVAQIGKTWAQCQQTVDPTRPLSPDPLSELAREVLNIIRSSDLNRLTVRRVEAMAIEELAGRNADWRLLIALEHGISEFDRLPISARAVALSDWLGLKQVRECSPSFSPDDSAILPRRYGSLPESTGDLVEAAGVPKYTRPHRVAVRSRTSACIIRKVRVAERSNLGRAYYDRAKACTLQGDVAGAVLAYETAVRFAPDFAEAHSNLGNLYLRSGRRGDALRAYATAIRTKPDLAPLYVNLAKVLIDLGRCDEAIAASETALRLAPHLYEAHLNLCQAYRSSGRDREALVPALHAIELRPVLADCMNLGKAALSLDMFDIAIEAFRRALELDATCANAHCNLGWLYHETGRYVEAIAAYETAIALRPDLAEAHRNLALSLLTCGDFARGWDEFAWTWRVLGKRWPYPYLDLVTLWNGETLAGRQLLITLDQGLEDAIQMVRYLPAVKARGARVILEVTAALVPLFADIAGVDELRVAGDGTMLARDVDLQVSLLGLPRALATNLASIPAPIPYLRAQPERLERWRPRLETSSRLRVGIVWADDPDHGSDRRRSVRLEDFASLGGIDGVAWFGLQQGRNEERRSCGSFALDPLSSEIGDFADAAAIVTHLDLVIGVDTAIVHLAGAMGVPVWTLLRFAADWRWLLARADSPWYPTMRLFRQPTPGDWASVFADVARELRALQLSGRPRFAGVRPGSRLP